MENEWDPYEVLINCTESIKALHRMQQGSDLQVSQAITLMTQLNSQIIMLSERINKLEDSVYRD
jgi:hypothetical protein